MELEIKDGEFIIRGKLDKPQASKTGKTQTLFSTRGLAWQNDGVYVNLTIGKRKEE